MAFANNYKRLSIAVLITCFNRKKTTLKCLEHLFNTNNTYYMTLDVYLVDDASSDGTTRAVEENYPGIQIIQGNGSLFWGVECILRSNQHTNIGNTIFISG